LLKLKDKSVCLRSLLWFVFGRANSLIVTIVGFVGVVAMVLGAIMMQSLWIAIIAAFILNGEKYAGQRILVIGINNYAYLVPYVENKEEVFLKTIIPSRKATEKYFGV
jgi:hypothetical protein